METILQSTIIDISAIRVIQKPCMASLTGFDQRRCKMTLLENLISICLRIE